MFAVARVDYSRFRELRVGIYSAMIASICLVLMFGAAARGSRRWIELPYFRFQPSELAKVLLIVSLAAFVIEHRRRGADWRSTMRLLAIGLTPAALVFLQPDLGTGIVLGVITLAILFLVGLPWRHFAAIGCVAALLGRFRARRRPGRRCPYPVGIQQERLTSFLNPSDDPGDCELSGQPEQDRRSAPVARPAAAIGLTDRARLPPRAAHGLHLRRDRERYGFLGAAFVLSLYALLVWRALRLLTLSKNLYGTLIAGGIAAMLMFQVFVNVGMNLGIMPVTGITLPLMSYGGSSVLVTFMAIGLFRASTSRRSSAARDSRTATPLLR